MTETNSSVEGESDSRTVSGAREKLRALLAGINRPLTLKAAEDAGFYNCPCCNGEGTVDAEFVSHITTAGAAGIQVYGIGDDLMNLEAWFTEAPALVEQLLAMIEKGKS